MVTDPNAIIGLACPCRERIRVRGRSFDAVEQVRPGAWHRFLATRGPVPCCVNHDPCALLGTTEDALQLWASPAGLRFRLRLSASHPATATVRQAVRLGQLRGVSVSWDSDGLVTEQTAAGWTVVHASISEVALIVGSQRPAYKGTVARPGTRAARRYLQALDNAARLWSGAMERCNA